MTNNPFKSIIPEIVAPAIPSPATAIALAMQYQLERSQWLPPKQMFEYQRRQFQAVLSHAVHNVPHYRESLRGVDIGFIHEITPERLRQLPILTRIDIQKAGDGIKSNAPPKHGNTYEVETSGTTGRAVKLLGNAITLRYWEAYALRDHFWHRRDFSHRHASIRWAKRDFGMPPGIIKKGWGAPLDEIFQTGDSMFLNIIADTRTQAEWLLQHDPEYLITHPSQAVALAEYFLRHDLKLTRLQHIRTVGETISARTREVCRTAWGVPVVDGYSCEEAGYLALQCPDHEQYHVQSESIHLEVVDEHGRPCAPGETGRVLITALHNFNTPLIRYELGDYAEVGAPCPCGRGLPVLTRILGRTRNRLVLPGGETRFPYLGERADRVSITTAVRKFQYVQHTETDIEVKMVVTEPLTADQETRLKAQIVKDLGYPFNITLSYHDEIPLSARGKYEEFISKVAV